MKEWSIKYLLTRNSKISTCFLDNGEWNLIELMIEYSFNLKYYDNNKV